MREREEEGGESQEREREIERERKRKREGDERKERKQDDWSFFMMKCALFCIFVTFEIYLPWNMCCMSAYGCARAR